MEFLKNLLNAEGFRILIVVIVLDTIFGILRAIKEKKINSAIGIDGIIRKVGMLIAIFFLSVIDNIISVDLIGFIPEEIKETLHFSKVGIADLFNLLFVVFETLSIFKNMILCKLPIPKRLQQFFEKIMKQFTGELDNKEELLKSNPSENKKEGE